MRMVTALLALLVLLAPAALARDAGRQGATRMVAAAHPLAAQAGGNHHA